MMTLSYHGAVRREVEEACDWYDERKDGLGDEFFQELEACCADRRQSAGVPEGVGGQEKGEFEAFPVCGLLPGARGPGEDFGSGA